MNKKTFLCTTLGLMLSTTLSLAASQVFPASTNGNNTFHGTNTFVKPPVGDGSLWTNLSASSLVGTVPDARLSTNVWGPANVKWWGAKGDATADDTAFIQAALDGCTNGGAVFLPKGIYHLTNTLYFRGRHVRLYGEGSGYNYDNDAGLTYTSDTQLKWTAYTAVGLSMLTNDYCKLENVQINGNSKLTNGILMGQSVPQIGGIANWLSGVTVSQCLGPGLRMVYYVNGTHIDHSSFSHNDTGIAVDGTESTDWTIDTSNIRQNRVGMLLQVGTLSASDCVVESNTETGIRFEYNNLTYSLADCKFSAIFMENNPTAVSCIGPYFTARITFANCVFNSYPGQTNILLKAARDWVFRECSFVSSTACSNLVFAPSHGNLFDRSIPLSSAGVPAFFPGGVTPAAVISVSTNNYRIDLDGGVHPFIIDKVGAVTVGGLLTATNLSTTTVASRLGVKLGTFTTISNAIRLEGHINAVNGGFSIDWNDQTSGNLLSRIASVLDSGGVTGELSFWSSVWTGTNAVERMRLTGGGNLGVGTVSPSGTGAGNITATNAIYSGTTITATNGFIAGTRTGIATTWTNLLPGIATNRIVVVGGIVVSNTAIAW